MTDTRRFFEDLPLIDRFDALSDPSEFRALPGDWVLGIADVVDSTKAIAAGRYKTVNMVGAAVISAQLNAHPDRSFPFVFGGDGANFALPPDLRDRGAEALSRVQGWTRDEFGLDLRGALLPVADLGGPLAVARYRPAPGVDYAMFTGAGLAIAENRLKSGDLGQPPAPPGDHPDLTGLSCRWSHVRARQGSIVSLIAMPAPDASEAAFAEFVQQVLAALRHLDRAGHPMPPGGATVRWPPPGILLEARASRRGRPLWQRLVPLMIENLFAWSVLASGIRMGSFDPRRYREEVVQNADFRKFDHGLKMTLDCDPATVAQLRAILTRAEARGVVRHGIFEQDEAMMTCIVPSVTQADHMHFVDGAAGGYAMAAAAMKTTLRAPRDAGV